MESSHVQEENPFTAAEPTLMESSNVTIDFQDSGYVPAVIEGKVDGGQPSTFGSEDPNFTARSSLLNDEPDSSGGKREGIFSAARWQQYFDVDTSDVLRRIYDSMFIPGEGNFLEKTTRQPDFYGPFWICTTLIFVTAAGGSVVQSLNKKDEAWYYDVGEITFSALLIYGYALLVPLVLYFTLRYMKNPLPFHSLLCIYGYSLFIFIPISMMCVVNSELFRWVVVLVASLESCAFLVVNIKERLSSMPEELMYGVLGGIAAVHLLLGLILKMHFFQYWN